MAATLKGENVDGDVLHLRISPDLKKGLQAVAQVKGRSLTQHVLLVLD